MFLNVKKNKNWSKFTFSKNFIYNFIFVKSNPNQTCTNSAWLHFKFTNIAFPFTTHFISITGHLVVTHLILCIWHLTFDQGKQLPSHPLLSYILITNRVNGVPSICSSTFLSVGNYSSNHLRSRTLELWLTQTPPRPQAISDHRKHLAAGQPTSSSCSKLSKTYGPLMTLKLGSRTTTVISSPDLAKEALQKHDQVFSSRTIPDTARAFDHHKFSMVWLPALAQWRSLRKVSAKHIFAPQRLDSTQAIRCKKVQQLLDHVKENCSWKTNKTPNHTRFERI